MIRSKQTVALQHTKGRGLIALALLLCSAAPVAQATPERAAKYYDDALRSYEKQDLPATAIHLKNAIQQDGKMLAAYLLFGKVLLGMGELKAAEAALEEALRQGVSRAEVAPVLGQVYLRLGETTKLLETITTSGLPRNIQPEILTLRGTAYAMSGNMSAASAAFAEARQLDPQSAAPLIAEAPLLLRVGEYDRAKALVIKATELEPKNAMGWYQLGTIQHGQGDRKGALASFDKAISLQPKLVDAHVSRAAVLLSLGNQAEAIKVLALLKEDKVVEPRASYLRASLASLRGDAKAAAADYNEAASLIDAMPPSQRSGSEALLLAGALSHRALGNLQKSREYLDTLLARNSRHYAAQVLMASVLLEAQEFHRAAPILDNLMRLTPNEPQVLYMMGSALMARKQYAQAAELFDRAAKIPAGGNEALRELAFSQFGLGQGQQAMATLEKVYAKNPKDFRAGVQLSISHARLGNSAKALQIAEAMVKLDPSNTAMLNFLGNIKGRLNDMKGQREVYQRVLALDPKFRPVIINLSWLDMDEGKLDDARARLVASLKTRANDPDVLFQLGVLEQRANRPTEALAHWAKADAASQGKDPRAGLSSVDLLLLLRQNDQALTTAKVLAGQFPQAVPVQLALAQAYMATGDLSMARSVLQEAGRFAGADVGYLITIGRTQLTAGHLDGANYSVSKALQAAPNDLGALVLQVEVAARRGQPKEVDTALAALVAKHPGKVPTLMTTGHVAFSRQQMPQAVTAYRTAFEREPVAPIALTLAQAYIGNREADKALALLDGWIKKNPKDLVIMRALGEVQSLLGRNDEARKSYGAVIAASPQDASALNSYAQLLYRIKDPEAIRMAEKAMKLAPNQAAYADTYGWLLAERGDLENGVRVLREARLREPGNGQIRWHLASALAKAGRKLEAKDELKAALASTSPPVLGPELSALKASLGL